MIRRLFDSLIKYKISRYTILKKFQIVNSTVMPFVVQLNVLLILYY